MKSKKSIHVPFSCKLVSGKISNLSSKNSKSGLIRELQDNARCEGLYFGCSGQYQPGDYVQGKRKACANVVSVLIGLSTVTMLMNQVF